MLKIIASDGKESVSSQLQIAVTDENEFTPQFRQPDFSFDLEAPFQPGSYVGQVVASDSDFSDRKPGKLTYEMASDSSSGLFTVQRDGMIVVGGKPIDKEGQYALEVDVKDSLGQRVIIISS